MKLRYFLIVCIFYLIMLVSASTLESPHLNVTLHEVSPNRICRGDYSDVTLVVEGVGDPTPLEVVFSIDYSGSMNNSDSTKKRLKATKKFVSSLNPSRDRAGLVAWNNDVIESRLTGLTNNFEVINSMLDMDISEEGIRPMGDTNYDAALSASIDLFESNSNNTNKCIIFLSDGEPKPDASSPYPAYTPPGKPGSQVTRAKENGIEIWTVGFSIGDDGKIILKEIADTTRGGYYSANNLTVEYTFNKIYKNMTSLAGKNVTVKYLAPVDLISSNQDFYFEGDDRVFTWKPVVEDPNGPRDYFYIGDSWTKTFKVSSENQGSFTLGKPGSEVVYTVKNKSWSDIPIEEQIDNRTLLVLPCNETCNESQNCNITKVKYVCIGDDYNINDTNINFGSGTFYNNCSSSPDSDSEPCEKIVCVCVDPACSECTEVVAGNGSKINKINIVQTTIFGS
ncbi:MAG TPA: vWA domain-containing protein, partial [Alphaproteobacteria bacterium]|nr:vWA domain-containing protein [Alphaproteobacteria bacterium]